MAQKIEVIHQWSDRHFPRKMNQAIPAIRSIRMRMEFSECINETLANEGRTYFRIEYKSNFSLSIYIVAEKAEMLSKKKRQTGSFWQTRLSIRFNNNWGIDGRDGEGRDRMSL
jgi:Holliday junction resolvase